MAKSGLLGGSRLGDLYVQYVNNYEQSTRALRAAEEHEEWRYFMKHWALLTEATGHGRHSLPSLLIQPVQRIPRYKLLLEQLLKETSTEHPDHPHLVATLEEVRRGHARISETAGGTAGGRRAQAREQGSGGAAHAVNRERQCAAPLPAAARHCPPLPAAARRCPPVPAAGPPMARRAATPPRPTQRPDHVPPVEACEKAAGGGCCRQAIYLLRIVLRGSRLCAHACRCRRWRPR